MQIPLRRVLKMTISMEEGPETANSIGEGSENDNFHGGLMY
jgi:hypothetical protein